MTDGVRTSLKFSRFFKDGNTKRNDSETQARSWKEWVGEKLKLGRKTGDGKHLVAEKITLFPGWAAKRYDDDDDEDEDDESFGIEVFVSGYASRTSQRTSRRQRVFIRLAKSFVSLPKLAPDSASEASTSLRPSVSDESLPADVNLSPRPTEEDVVQTLEREFQRASAADDNGDESCDTPPSYAHNHAELHPQGSGIIGGSSSKSLEPADIRRRQHDNLEQRLQHFWARALPTRTVRLHLFASPDHSSSSTPSPKKQHPHGPAHDAVDIQDVMTAADGSFQTLFRLTWTDLRQHPGTQHIASGGSKEHEFFLSAQLLPSPASTTSSPSVESSPPGSIRSQVISFYSRRERVPKQSSSPPLPSTISIPLSSSPIRVISDIDDTVKLSDILLGPRAMFRNLFIKDLHENIIPSMSEWYAGMWNRGVRFHYVSNSPFEILPIINEFLQVSRLPPGSIKLKSYAGSSLFNDVLTAHGTRKRPGVLEILSAFPDSRFFLIGDSGQQDLELYADLAQERPTQILAVLIRYADNICDPIDDTTGERVIGSAGTRTSPLLSGSANADDRPRTARKLSDMLSRSSSSSPKLPPPILTLPLNIPRSAKREDATGVADDFSLPRFTTEPESDTLPSPLLAPSTPPKSNLSSSLKNRSPSIPSPRISPSAMFTTRQMSSPSTASPLSYRSSTSSRMSDVNKKRTLQRRVYNARKRIPGHIPLRVFKDPSECVEVEEELRRVGL